MVLGPVLLPLLCQGGESACDGWGVGEDAWIGPLLDISADQNDKRNIQRPTECMKAEKTPENRL
jgi:hypothetical protein